MFGNKKEKQERLFSIPKLVRKAAEGITQAELARKLNVSRKTIMQDMGHVENVTGSKFWEDDNGRYHWSDYND